MAAAGVDEQKLLHILVSLSPPPSLPLSFRLSLSSFLSLSLCSSIYSLSLSLISLSPSSALSLTALRMMNET